MDLADRVINGDFGNGEERKRRLGCFYPIVQNEVNRRLGYSKRHDLFDYIWDKMKKAIIPELLKVNK